VSCCNGKTKVESDPPISATIIRGLADELAARADNLRDIYKHVSHAGRYDALVGLLMEAAEMCDQHRLDIHELSITRRTDLHHAATDARWLESQAQLYASQEGRRQHEMACLMRAGAFLCAARGASLEDLMVHVDAASEELTP
jgi:hypothetical protein